MQPKVHTALLLGALVLAYVWLQLPQLSNYTLQAVALTTVVFFLSRILRKKKVHHWLPDPGSFDMVIVTFGLMILIGGTGNLHSPLAFLMYIHLFVLVMTSAASTSIIVGSATMLFHYALTPTMQPYDWSILLTIPTVLLIFLFAKEQHEEVVLAKKTITAEQDQLKANQVSLESRDTTIERLAAANRAYQERLEQSQVVLAKLKLDLLALRERYFSCEPEAQQHIDQLCQSLELSGEHEAELDSSQQSPPR